MPLEPQAELLEQYHAALQSYIYEGSAFWQRISVFVLLNSALLVARNALPAGPTDRWVRVAISLLGVAATLLWAHTAVRAHYIINFWTALMQELESRLVIDSLGPYTLRERYLGGRPVEIEGRPRMLMPWYGRGNVNDSSSAVLTTVFGAIWIVSIFRL